MERDLLGRFILLAWDYEAQHVFLVSGFTDPGALCPRAEGQGVAPRAATGTGERVPLRSEEPSASEPVGPWRAQGPLGLRRPW